MENSALTLSLGSSLPSLRWYTILGRLGPSKAAAWAAVALMLPELLSGKPFGEEGGSPLAVSGAS
jgi:hypothetical protein